MNLSADDVLQMRFRSTRFREGYDQDEVDDFLDTMASILEAHEEGRAVDASAAAELCRDARFQPTRMREGYDQEEVDELLAQLEHDFRTIAQTAAAAAGGGAPAGEGGTPVAGGDAPATAAGAPTTGGGPRPTAPDISGRPGEYPVGRKWSTVSVITGAAVVVLVAALAALFVL